MAPKVAPKKNPKTAPKSSKTKTVDVYVQPKFDDRIAKTLARPFLSDNTSVPGQGTFAGIRRGFMVWDDTVPPPSGYDKKDKNYPAHVNFLYNPSTISTSYQVANGSAQAALNYGTTQGLDQSLLLPIQQQTSFSIMFDRTYELSDPTQDADMHNFGVDVDIAAIRQFTGMYAGVYSGNANYIPYTSNNTQQTSTGVSRPNPNQINDFVQPLGNLAQGVMQVTLGFVYFSGPTSNAVGGKGYGITYYGYIDTWSVEYTHFTQNMIPVRAVIDISFTFLPPPVKTPDTKGAAALSAAQIVNDNLGILPPTPALVQLTNGNKNILGR